MTARALQIAAYALVAIVALWAGVRMYAGRTPVGKATASTMATPVGEASAPTGSDMAADFEAQGPLAPKIPERLPNFSLHDRTGKDTSIDNWKGKSLVLNFWATWCAPCRREIPLLKTLYAEWGARDVAVVGVAIDYPDKVVAFANELKIPYPLLIGEQDALDVAAAFGVDTPVFPFTVFTDKRGQVVTLYLGELHKRQADLILSVLQTLNRDQVELSEARRSIADGLHALTADAPG